LCASLMLHVCVPPLCYMFVCLPYVTCLCASLMLPVCVPPLCYMFVCLPYVTCLCASHHYCTNMPQDQCHDAPWYTFMGYCNIQMLCIPPIECVRDFCHSQSTSVTPLNTLRVGLYSGDTVCSE